MERFIDYELFIIPGPGVGAGSYSQISLLRVVVVHFEKEIPDIALFDEERVGYEFGGDIGNILRAKERIDPALQRIEVERRIAAINTDGPLFSLSNKGYAALDPNVNSADKPKEQT